MRSEISCFDDPLPSGIEIREVSQRIKKECPMKGDIKEREKKSSCFVSSQTPKIKMSQKRLLQKQ